MIWEFIPCVVPVVNSDVSRGDSVLTVSWKQVEQGLLSWLPLSTGQGMEGAGPASTAAWKIKGLATY